TCVTWRNNLGNPIRIGNREDLIFILSEASTLEHMVMCEYLFAAFSLKRGTGEGLTSDQLKTVTKWERVISDVATQEMLHLSLVNNMLTAIGAAPYFGRPNFPHPSNYFPPSIQLVLLPFGEEAQATSEYCGWPKLTPVTDLKTATEAVEAIVTEGEGARGDWTNAHFGKFLGILNEYMEMKKQNADFAPARPVVPAYVRPPND